MQHNLSKTLNILIIHESSVIRNIIRNYILADHPDAVIDPVDSSADLSGKISEKAFDLVFSGLEMPGMSGLDLRELLRSSSANARTPLVIMTASDSPEQQKRLAAEGIRHILPLPCTSIRFRKMLFSIFNPDACKTRTFYTIPDARAVILLPDREIPAEIADIREKSLVCELEWNGKPEELGNANAAKLRFPADYGKASTIHMTAHLEGLRTIRSAGAGRVRAIWKIVWEGFELHAATKKPVMLGFREMAEEAVAAAENTEPLSGENARLTEENRQLRDEIETLETERQDFLEQVDRLRSRIAELEKSGGTLSVKDISLDSLINQVPKPTDDAAKRSIFKKIIADNVELRK